MFSLANENQAYSIIVHPSMLSFPWSTTIQHAIQRIIAAQQPDQKQHNHPIYKQSWLLQGTANHFRMLPWSTLTAHLFGTSATSTRSTIDSAITSSHTFCVMSLNIVCSSDCGVNRGIIIIGEINWHHWRRHDDDENTRVKATSFNCSRRSDGVPIFLDNGWLSTLYVYLCMGP